MLNNGRNLRIYTISGGVGLTSSVIYILCNILFLGVFILAAAVQWNDPDPLPWMVIYLSAASMCFLSLVHRQVLWLPSILLLFSLGWAFYLLSSIVGHVSLYEITESLSMKTRAVEEAREIGGLLLVALWATIVWIIERRIQP